MREKYRFSCSQSVFISALSAWFALLSAYNVFWLFMLVGQARKALRAQTKMKGDKILRTNMGVGASLDLVFNWFASDSYCKKELYHKRHLI